MLRAPLDRPVRARRYAVRQTQREVKGNRFELDSNRESVILIAACGQDFLFQPFNVPRRRIELRPAGPVEGAGAVGFLHSQVAFSGSRSRSRRILRDHIHRFPPGKRVVIPPLLAEYVNENGAVSSAERSTLLPSGEQKLNKRLRFDNTAGIRLCAGVNHFTADEIGHLPSNISTFCRIRSSAVSIASVCAGNGAAGTIITATAAMIREAPPYVVGRIIRRRENVFAPAPPATGSNQSLGAVANGFFQFPGFHLEPSPFIRVSDLTGEKPGGMQSLARTLDFYARSPLVSCRLRRLNEFESEFEIGGNQRREIRLALGLDPGPRRFTLVQ